MRYRFICLVLLIVFVLGIAIEIIEYEAELKNDVTSIIPYVFPIPEQFHEPVQQTPITQIKLQDVVSAGTPTINVSVSDKMAVNDNLKINLS